MSGETVLVPGARRVETALDVPDDATDTDACAVACPPHPRRGGHRGDARLLAVSDALTARGIACLRIDYGDWDGGYGEREDARNALRWATERYERVGCIGYSFGAAIAALAAASVEVSLRAVALLAPTRLAADGLDVVTAVRDIDVPLYVVYGERDTTADWRPAVAAARDAGATVTALATGHAVAGSTDVAAASIGSFLAAELRG
ncbi:hypothetical protein MBEHAL_2111 [Halarchaeum acidiphilum MH1-52-1]|uniref:Dienelactone hydrolase domain-containing protein n=1 Tax=Halarchaeum acidiphilum MH1-52-1 TaxID=1261545 RepID=U2YGG5_9EURY|nr:dienelactone hydrolase family protein [Halarchaeum acidiphilum]GAD53351.1 hypothetical protein MBEHAL_2111 [Halarchaeum acidiphilum MH1-52-1]